MTAYKVNPSLVETLATYAQANPLSLFIGLVVILAAITYQIK